MKLSLLMDSRVSQRHGDLIRVMPDFPRGHRRVIPESRDWAVGKGGGGRKAARMGIKRPSFESCVVDSPARGLIRVNLRGSLP